MRNPHARMVVAATLAGAALPAVGCRREPDASPAEQNATPRATAATVQSPRPSSTSDVAFSGHRIRAAADVQANLTTLGETATLNLVPSKLVVEFAT